MRAGNANLKGKKYKLMRCGCCVAIDYRDKFREMVDKKEIKDYINGRCK